MGIQKPMRRLALMMMCACGGMALFGLSTAGSALAVTCTSTTGSGSTLQSEVQQKDWAVSANNGGFFTKGGCAAVPSIKYNEATGTGSGQALEEWGFGGGALMKAKSANGTTLDGYIGTDDPPSLTEEQNASKAGQASIETVPVTDAPIAIILHPPAACVIKTTKFNVGNAQLSEVWLNGTKTWASFLTAIGATSSGTCTATITHEVRSDASGTSFAFKQYLSHVDSVSWNGFVKDDTSWPTKTMAKTTHVAGPNKGSSGEAQAVSETEGSIGYVNTADASKNGFGSWSTQTKLFWAQVQDNGTKAEAAAFAEPVSGSAVNCPAELGSGTVPSSAEQPNWSGTQLAFPTVAAGKYSLCTLTFDEFWGKYAGTTLNTEYGSAGSTVGSSMKRYCEFMTGPGQKGLPFGYGPLPTAVQTRAEETCEIAVAKDSA